jgi:hypothetical protein
MLFLDVLPHSLQTHESRESEWPDKEILNNSAPAWSMPEHSHHSVSNNVEKQNFYFVQG